MIIRILDNDRYLVRGLSRRQRHFVATLNEGESRSISIDLSRWLAVGETVSTATATGAYTPTLTIAGETVTVPLTTAASGLMTVTITTSTGRVSTLDIFLARGDCDRPDIYRTRAYP